MVRKYFTVSNKTYHVFANPDHHWIAINCYGSTYTYQRKPRHSKPDYLKSWTPLDFLDVEFEPVVLSKRAELAMMSVGWDKSLRRLRKNRGGRGSK